MSPYKIRTLAKTARNIPDGLFKIRLRADDIHITEIIAAIRDGVHVSIGLLAYLMRAGCPLPQDVRVYIAGRLDRSIKHKGRPVEHPSRVQPGWVYANIIESAELTWAWTDNLKAIKAIDRAIRHEKLKEEYGKEREEMKRLKKENPVGYAALCKKLKRLATSPERLAYAVLAERHTGETYDSIRNAIKRAPRK